MDCPDKAESSLRSRVLAVSTENKQNQLCYPQIEASVYHPEKNDAVTCVAGVVEVQEIPWVESLQLSTATVPVVRPGHSAVPLPMATEIIKLNILEIKWDKRLTGLRTL